VLRGKELCLPPLPESVIRIQRLLDSPECDLEKLATAIQLDPALSTKIVGISNSPFYMGMEAVHGVQDAMIRVGLRETRNIVFAITLRSKVFRAPGFERAIHHLWIHSLAASLSTQAVAAELAVDPDLGFMGGLIHDVGRAVVLSLAGDVTRRSRGVASPRPETVERVLERFHERLGARVANSWHLVPELASAIAWHHHPEGAPTSAALLARTLAIGDTMARHLMAHGSDSVAAKMRLEDLVASTSLDADDIQRLEIDVREELQNLNKSL